MTDLPPEGAWLVGGAVRDELLGRSPGPDVDLVVEGPLDPVLAVLGGEVLARHDRFGTAELLVEGRRVDVARARTESYPLPGALPEVSFASLDDDLRRRDFTVNTFARDRSGTLRSAPGAKADLAVRQLRVLHHASFSDDPTRLFRLVRYAARLNFGIEDETRSLAEGARLDTISGQRVGNELQLILDEDVDVARRAFSLAGEIGFFPVRDPTLLDRVSSPLALLAAVVSSVPDDWGFKRRDRDAVVQALSVDERLIEEVHAAGRPSAVASLLRPLADPALDVAAALGAAESVAWWRETGRHVRGELPPAERERLSGPALGEALRRARDAELDRGLPG